jgi:hypothetical protein
VRVVTISTAHFPFEDRMVVRQSELGTDFKVALETCLGRFPRIDDRSRTTARFHMEAARTMARFTSDILRVISLC